jgi:hypothetical protein
MFEGFLAIKRTFNFVGLIQDGYGTEFTFLKWIRLDDKNLSSAIKVLISEPFYLIGVFSSGT